MNQIWFIAAAVSVVGHGAIAWWLGAHDPAPVTPKSTVVRFQAWRPEPPKETPPPPEPPQETPPPPKLVKRTVPRPPSPEPLTPPPPSATQTHVEEPAASGITSDQSAAQGTLAVQSGGGVTGPVQDGHGKAPPAPPAAPKKTVYVPIFEVSRLPRAIDPVQPVVPEAWRTTGREAVVVVEVAISASGAVVDARAVKTAGYGLDEAAVAAAKKTRFEPALVGDKPVAVRMQLPYRFKVRG